MNGSLSSLRPSLKHARKSILKTTYIARVRPSCASWHKEAPLWKSTHTKLESNESRRQSELKTLSSASYPRLRQHPDQISCHAFVGRYENLTSSDAREHKDIVGLYGKYLGVLSSSVAEIARESF